MGIVIDTNILIACEKGTLDMEQLVARYGNVPVFLSVVSASELLHGVHRATERQVRNRRMAFVERVLDGMAMLDIDLATARIHAKLWSDMAGSGQMIGAHDLWIAATALANDCVLATRNIREFKRVPGLQVEVW